MAFSKAVQFRGIKNVVKAYESKKVPAWGLFQQTQFLEKYEGDNLEEGAQRCCVTIWKHWISAVMTRTPIRCACTKILQEK